MTVNCSLFVSLSSRPELSHVSVRLYGNHRILVTGVGPPGALFFALCGGRVGDWPDLCSYGVMLAGRAGALYVWLDID